MGSMSPSTLLQPAIIGNSINLRNRICMGALTRNRCIDNCKPTSASVKHYADRARDGTGLIVSEGIFVYLTGTDWVHAPVLFETEHAEAWKKVTDAVHMEGGKIYCQTWHAGRAQHDQMPMLKNNRYPVLVPSKIPASGGKYRELDGNPSHTTHLTEITNPDDIIEQYRNSAVLAKAAGFDGVEILAQGGYLLQNFLLSRSNQRADKYGGSVENRCRFVLEVVDAIISVWGAAAVSVKYCPTDDVQDTASPYAEISKTYTYLTRQLIARKIGYICLTRRGSALPRDSQDNFFEGLTSVRPPGTELPDGYEPLQEFGPMIKFPGSKTLLMVNHEYTVEEAEQLVRQDKIDLVCFGRPFMFNPDVVTRIRCGVPFATNNRDERVNYGPYEDPNEGYNDWPAADIQL